MPRVFQNPKQLVDEFKKSGEFDRLRRQLLIHFANSDEVRPLMSRVEEIAREKLSSDERLEHKSREAVNSEVMQDMERYPIVERAVSELAVFKDDALLTSIEQYVRNIVRGENNDNPKLWNAISSRRKRNTREDNEESSDFSEEEEPGDDELQIVTDADRQTVVASTDKHQIRKISTEPTGTSPHLILKEETQPATPGHASTLSSSPARCIPLEPESHTPPWYAQHQDDVRLSSSYVTSPHTSSRGRPNSPSTIGGPSSDSLAGRLLVNGVPAGGPMLDSPIEPWAEAEETYTQPEPPDTAYAETHVDSGGPRTVYRPYRISIPLDYEQDIRSNDISSPSAVATAQPPLVPKFDDESPQPN